mgnify:CR=1 FL=1
MDYHKTDPEFAEIIERFALDEAVNQKGQELAEDIRLLVIMAALMGCQGLETFRKVLPEALQSGLTPVMIKELVYQSAAYLGLGRTLPFLDALNEYLSAHELPVSQPIQGTANPQNRLEKGFGVQAEIFGSHMKEAWKNGHINYWLAANCFGDYYTRRGLTLAQRELITFCFLAAQGGCEPQLTAHAAGNMNLGTDRDYLIRVVSQILPYIGYPRSLNAISCVNKAAEERK